MIVRRTNTNVFWKYVLLHIVRIVIAVIVLSLLVRVFILRGNLSHEGALADLLDAAGNGIVEVQFVPLILSLTTGVSIMLVIIGIMIVMTLLFGRIYCATVCPLGICQDIAFRAGNVVRKKKLGGIRGKHILWFSICAVSIFSGFAGLTVLLGWIDPYSLFGKVMLFTIRPISSFVYNHAIIYFIPDSSGFAQKLTVSTFVPVYFAICLTFGIALAALAFLKGRIWCNFICPVGAVLSLISRFALFKMRIGKSCVSCGLCEGSCRGRCINVDEKTIEDDRCVRCFDCAATCPAGAITYGFRCNSAKDDITSESRKSFIRNGLVSGAAIGVGMIFPDSVVRALSTENQNYPIPPGGMNQRRFSKRCTSCGLCAGRCPTGVIRPAVFEKGVTGLMQPVLDFTKGYCVYECSLCSEICPTGAIKAVSKEEKKKLSIGYAVFDEQKCIVYRNGTSCGACAEVCPTHAVTMVKFRKGLMIPVVEESLCIGCGACVFRCPARPVRALHVNGREEQIFISTQQKKRKPKKTEKGMKGKEDFPF